MGYNHKGMIHTLDSVWSVCETKIAKLIAEELSYVDVYWRKSYKKPGKKERVERKICMLECRGDQSHYFHTGFIPRVLNFCEKYNIPYEYSTDVEPTSFDEPHIESLTFRDYQNEALEAALQNGRGVLKAATGVGKSIVLAGLMSAFSEENILFLCHSNDLVKQIIQDYIEEFNIGEYGEFSGSSKDLSKRITVATVQSFKNVVDKQMYHYDVVMIDECHHSHRLDSQYGYVLQRLAAPIKFGTTATLPNTEGGRMCLEALIGPVIHEITIKEAISDLKVLAKPEMKIIKQEPLPDELLYDMSDFPVPEKHRKNPEWFPTRYALIYWNAIVKNTGRNLQVLQEAEEHYKKGETVLINIIRTEHIRELLSLAAEQFPKMKIVCVYGNTPPEKREKIKQAFEKKKIRCVIASVVWSEGVDVRSLDCVINAASGKSEIRIFQTIGRGLRKTEKKSTVKIVDFHDRVRYMNSHFKGRLKIYKELGWVKD